jgi:hypothetical protein
MVKNTWETAFAGGPALLTAIQVPKAFEKGWARIGSYYFLDGGNQQKWRFVKGILSYSTTAMDDQSEPVWEKVYIESPDVLWMKDTGEVFAIRGRHPEDRTATRRYLFRIAAFLMECELEEPSNELEEYWEDVFDGVPPGQLFVVAETAQVDEEVPRPTPERRRGGRGKKEAAGPKQYALDFGSYHKNREGRKFPKGNEWLSVQDQETRALYVARVRKRKASPPPALKNTRDLARAGISLNTVTQKLNGIAS